MSKKSRRKSAELPKKNPSNVGTASLTAKLRPLSPPASQSEVRPRFRCAACPPGGGAGSSVFTAAAGERCQVDEEHAVKKSRRRLDK